ncbi:hypothetical protein ACK3SF_05705 [Candidatus Nanosalina sp. VS9-1]|uniref:hypothetical protein n=1 Tax=Candidatus Nanosalina sp. VS9-1 TaxID=3388566 RepID=UPI0039E0E5D6
MINAVVGLGYEVVRETWYVTSILAKYFLAATLALLIYQKNFSVEKVEEKLLENGKEFVLACTGLGVISFVLSLELRPFLPFVSQFIAVAYLGFLFWKY